MAEHVEAGSHVSQEKDRDSAASDSESDTAADHDSFEDAVDSSPVQSLTKRSLSAGKLPQQDGADDTDDRSNHIHEPESTEEHHVSPSEREASPSSNRVSSASNLENVNLDDEVPPQVQVDDSTSSADKEQASKSISLSSITNALPTMPWSPSTESPSRSPNPPVTTTTLPPPLASNNQPTPRKLTSPFSWLSRNSSNKDKDGAMAPTNQTSPRRNTASSIATLTSNPEMMLSKLEEEKEFEHTDGRSSLRDRFKLLRMRDEAGISPSAMDAEYSGGAIASVGRKNSTASGLPMPAEEELAGDKAPSAAVVAPGQGLEPTPGAETAPSVVVEAQVDWDLWQSVVYEGPSAVARTSAEELNRAIATGIPSAIRGVIWQVLAQSKNEELETVYEALVARGTEKENDRHSSNTATSSISNVNQGASNGDRDTSSASSVHSDLSGANGLTSPRTEKIVETLGKAQAAAAVERKRRDKEDAALLQKLEKTIRRDLGARTSFSKHAVAAGLQDGLFGVCKAYALYDEGVGYTQGMNFLIMPFLFNMPEQEAFCMVVRLMNHYQLRDLFIQDMPGLHMRLYQFERLLEDNEPALYCHLHRRGITPHLYATQWFLTLFAYRFPLQLVLRIYDLILSEGLSAILRFGIVLMQKNASTLLTISDMQQLTVYLKDKLFDVYIDKDPSQGSLLESGFFGSSSSNVDKEVYRADQLVTDACEVKISPELLKAYTMEWEEKTKSEKQREMELQALRTANANFAVQVRKLEERVEACDHEQVALGTGLVHTKVENQELKDENDSLNGQVRELKVVIESQPLEIEEKWKLERDDLMKRNVKVHEENEKLEKELAELEEQLVLTKMRYAEINDQHETLNRKWADLRRQFA